ncbi:YdcF family protein [Nocardia harenae]|uniref:YdcF family protein n=1 Tax=Nocardia harenae TaxID=358707 RepID=UPI000830CEC2|nr:YdcF family protein [Nocardia harenae]
MAGRHRKPAPRPLRKAGGALAGLAAAVAIPATAGASSGSAGLESLLSAVIPSGATAVAGPPAVRGPETAVVILGYGLLPDGTMRPELVERLQAGYVQALLAPASPVVVTGGNPQQGVTEAAAMADWLIAHGIAPGRIYIESEAASTVQNAEYTAQILRDIGARDAVVVTSADHIARARTIFDDAGIVVAAGLTPDQLPGLVRQFGL